VRICTEIWGYGYQTKAAKALGISRKTVNFYAKGKTIHGKIVTIKQETENKLMEIYNAHKTDKRTN
jgi:DNA-binding XRE family transcriptional regulator